MERQTRNGRGTPINGHDVTDAGAIATMAEPAYRLAFDRNPQPMWVYDVETLRFMAVNDAAVGRYGYGREEFLSMTILDIRPTEDVAALDPSLTDPGAEDSLGHQWRHRLSDDTLIDVLTFASDLPFEGRAGRLMVAIEVTQLKRAEAQLKARAQQQASMAALGRRAAEAPPLDELMQEAVEAVALNLDVEFATVFELSQDRPVLVLRAVVGMADELVGTTTVPVGDESQAGYALHVREPVVTEDLSAETRFKGSAVLHDHGIVSGASVVIHGEHGPLGVLSANSTEHRRFSRQDIHFLQVVAMVLSSAVGRERADRLERELGHARLRSYEETVRRLSMAVKTRDPETGRHIERIAVISAQLATALGLAAEHVERLRAAAPMHDLGKIGIPDRILQKPGKLTEDERREMQGHAEIGHRLLAGSQADLLELGALIALTHHEHFDGAGYPRGLEGEEIPIEGRIVAVADVFDALTSDRPYRPAFSPEEALEIVRDGHGTHFDPRIVDALLEHVAESGLPHDSALAS